MTTKPQVIFDNGKPAFVVLRYEDYMRLARDGVVEPSDDAEFVPFVLTDYIKNPIRVARIEAGLNQQQLSKLLCVTQGYVSRMEGRSFNVSEELLWRVRTAIAKYSSHKRRTTKRH